MMINHYLRILYVGAAFLTASETSAQTLQCSDTIVHRQLQEAMWKASGGNSRDELYDACVAFHRHAKEEGDIVAANNAWVCGIMYNLGKMDIKEAYYVTQAMKTDIMTSRYPEAGDFYVANMLGHIYNTCGNIPGAQEELLKSAELIKGTMFEREGLAFIYLALAHAHLNNDLKESLHWIDVTLEEAGKFKGSWNYYRALIDAYAIKAIVRFKQRNYDAFNKCFSMMEDVERTSKISSGDLFAPYARIYKTLIDGDTGKALAEADALSNLKEQYLVKCDIFRYIGDNDKAFLTQRELMHKRDSITGVMIAENMRQHEAEIGLVVKQKKTARVMNFVLLGAVALAFLVIVLLVRILLIRRNFSKRLMVKNEELRAAYKKVTAADEMKTEFIRNVSHEIRTPLNIINGFSQVLTDEDCTFTPEERHEIATTIGENTRQITSLVNKMLALANESTKDLMVDAVETDVADVCRRAIEAMPIIDTEKIKVEFIDSTDGETTIETNGDSLLQILENLLENAAKFTEQGHIYLKLDRDDENFYFTVEDTGCGIPDDKKSTIFEYFVKADEFKQGLGLGLAYCHKIAKKLNGKLLLVKTSDEGTTFTLNLPIKLKKHKTL